MRLQYILISVSEEKISLKWQNAAIMYTIVVSVCVCIIILIQLILLYNNVSVQLISSLICFPPASFPSESFFSISTC